jgi:hypothetical protein
MEVEVVRLAIEGETVAFRWGEPHELGSAAYWVEQTRLRQPSSDHRLGQSLVEETAACILGGYGLPAEVGLAAFEQVREAGLLCARRPPTALQVQSVLEQPLNVPGRERSVRYRFPRQRGARVSAALHFLSRHSAPGNGRDLRDWLLAVPGVGPKTASWIARNWIGAEDVAIIDIHIRRAGLAAGFFSPHWKLPSHYSSFENAFSEIARLGGVSCAALDARIWQDLSFLGNASHLLLGAPPEAPLL